MGEWAGQRRRGGRAGRTALRQWNAEAGRCTRLLQIHFRQRAMEAASGVPATEEGRAMEKEEYFIWQQSIQERALLP